MISADVSRTLRALRLRMVTQAALRTLARSTLLAGGVLVGICGVSRWYGWSPSPVVLLGAGAAAVLLWTLAVLVARFPSLAAIAPVIDRRGATCDRFQTALALAGVEGSMPSLARSECEAFIRDKVPRSVAPISMPRESPWLLVPAAAISLLLWDLRQVGVARDLEAGLARAEVANTVNELEALAAALEKEGALAKNQELQRLAEQLRRSAEQVASTATEREKAARSALRELSALESLVRDMQKTPGQLSLEERQALAKALEEEEAGRALAEALKKDGAGEAAKALQEAIDKASSEAGKQQAMQDALKKALERLAQQRELSQSLQDLARQMQQGGAGGEALKRLAEMLQRMPGGQSPSKPSGSPQQQERTLQDLLAALQSLKQGSGKPGENKDGKGQPSPGEGESLAQSFALRTGKPGPSSAELSIPSGQPGSERDEGTTANPFGKPGEPGAKGDDEFLSGQLGDGESLSQMLPTAGGDDRAQRRYRELYEAMAPAAESAVNQENIPLGSRFYIKRYFESIRPPQ